MRAPAQRVDSKKKKEKKKTNLTSVSASFTRILRTLNQAREQSAGMAWPERLLASSRFLPADPDAAADSSGDGEVMDVPLFLVSLFTLMLISLASLAASWFLRTRRPGTSQALYFVALCAAWYGVSVALVLLLRAALPASPAPVAAMLALMHIFVKGCGAALLLAVGAGACSPARLRTGACGSGICGCWAAAWAWARARGRLSRSVLLSIVVPLGATAAGDIVLSNLAIARLDVATYTLGKATSLVFTYVASVALGLLRPGNALSAAVAGVAVGAALSAYREPAPASGPSVAPTVALVDFWGLLSVLGAAACSGARWALTEKFFARPGVEPSVLLLLVLQSPIGAALAAPLAVAEVPALVAAATPARAGALLLVGGLGGGALAFALLFLEMELVRVSSALTTNVAGHLKDLVAIAAATAILGEVLSPANAAGVLLTVGSALVYARLRHAELRATAAALAAADASADIVDSSAMFAAGGTGAGATAAAASPAAAASAAVAAAVGGGSTPAAGALDFTPVNNGAGTTATRTAGLSARIIASARYGLDLDDLSSDSDGGESETGRLVGLRASLQQPHPQRPVSASAGDSADDTAASTSALHERTRLVNRPAAATSAAVAASAARILDEDFDDDGDGGVYGGGGKHTGGISSSVLENGDNQLDDEIDDGELIDEPRTSSRRSSGGGTAAAAILIGGQRFGHISRR